MTLPTFIIAGCGKAGTTSLYTYLAQHPDIFMASPKEPRYFFHPESRPHFAGPMDEERYNKQTIYKWGEYCSLFEHAAQYKAIGEASPVYMLSDKVPSSIYEKIPDVKILIILRNPVDIAYSAYNHQVREGGERLSFKEALAKEPDRIRANWAWHWRYTTIGMVVPSVLKEYLRVFPKGNVKIIFYDDFRKNNQAVVKDIFEWLDVDASVEIIRNRANVGGLYKYGSLIRFLQLIRRSLWWQAVGKVIPSGIKLFMSKILLVRDYPRMAASDRHYLIEVFEENIRELSSITGRNLDHWLSEY